MLLVLEIAMLIGGIVALATGKITLSKNNVYTGGAVRVAGAIMLLPLPLAFLAGFLWAASRVNEGLSVDSDANRVTLIVMELSITLICLVVSVVAAKGGESAAVPTRRRSGDEWEDDDRPRERRGAPPVLSPSVPARSDAYSAEPPPPSARPAPPLPRPLSASDELERPAERGLGAGAIVGMAGAGVLALAGIGVIVWGAASSPADERTAYNSAPPSLKDRRQNDWELKKDRDFGDKKGRDFVEKQARNDRADEDPRRVRVEEPEPPLPAFPDPPNPYRAGTQTKLREIASFKAPGKIVQIAYSPRHELLFLRDGVADAFPGTGIRDGGARIWVIDVKTQREVGMRTAQARFTDMGLSPDESVLFAADYAGENTGHGTPSSPHYVHRFDLATRTWERRTAPKVAGDLQTVDANHVLLVAYDQWVDVTLNRWEAKEEKITQVSRAGAGRSGVSAYNPRTGLFYHMGMEINVLRVRGESFRKADGDRIGGHRRAWGKFTLAADGKYLYLGTAQLDALIVQNTVRSMPEPTLAAGRDLAFGANAYYETESGKEAGKLGYPCAICHVDLHGMDLWTYESGTGTLRHYRIEGEQ